MSKTENQKAAAAQRKLQYSRPRLIRYGAVADLTLGQGGTQTDGNGTHTRGQKAGN
jgi:hypothetical protein